MKSSIRIKRIALTGLFTALIFVSTCFVKIPITLGYIHFGDVFIILAGFMLSPFCAVCAATVGSVLADLLSGFVIYIPVTFFVKGVMALIVSLAYYKKTTVARFILGAVFSSVIMILSYFIFECFIYGFELATINLPMQFLQSLVAVTVGGVMIFSLKRVPLILRVKDELFTNTSKKAPKNREKGDI